jgi:xanthine dehydrogenase small subunit
MTPQTLRFFRNGRVVTLDGVDPSRTLLQVLREDLHACGTKEGCGEGDCGACCVVLAQPSADGMRLDYRTINSCIRLAHSIDGMALWTVEDIAPTTSTAPDSAALHPAQEAMVQCHGSQCGFCTPGFVMSLFGLYQNHTARGATVSREEATEALSGNLCRCTGYRPIVDAALTMQTAPLCAVDEAEVLSKLELLAHIPRGLEADLASNSAYLTPRTLRALLAARAQNPQAQLVAGCTDVGLWVTKMHRQFAQVIDTTRVAELRRIEPYPHHLAIGAAVTLTDAFAALVAERPQLAEFAHRFAGLPVRNSGTLGGNVANGSPIGDSMPLLIALGASVVLMRQQGKKILHREMLLEDLYTGYRQNVMAPDEVLAWIKVPKATPSELLRVYKISKRFEDDISAVCLAIRLHIENGTVQTASIGVGGVAATPVRARRAEKALQGQRWNAATVERAMPVLMDEFAPISDMRASAAYRTQVLGNLLQRFWLEAQGEVPTDVRRLHPLGVHA